MRLDKQLLCKYRKEIHDLYAQYLDKQPVGVIYFGEFDQPILKGFGLLKCYSGNWYMRGCVVKPQYRGQGLQRKLIQQRVSYLQGKAPRLRVGIFPDNKYSIENVLAEGFTFVKQKPVETGVLNIYEKQT